MNSSLPSNNSGSSNSNPNSNSSGNNGGSAGGSAAPSAGASGAGGGGGNNTSLKVLEAYTRDVGRGIARIDYDTMDSLAVSTSDVLKQWNKPKFIRG